MEPIPRRLRCRAARARGDRLLEDRRDAASSARPPATESGSCRSDGRIVASLRRRRSARRLMARRGRGSRFRRLTRFWTAPLPGARSARASRSTLRPCGAGRSATAGRLLRGDRDDMDVAAARAAADIELLQQSVELRRVSLGNADEEQDAAAMAGATLREEKKAFVAGAV